MRETDIKTIIDATIGVVPRTAVLELFSHLNGPTTQLENKLLQIAETNEDADEVECALMVGGLFGSSVESSPVLRRLALADWHERHEDVVTALDHFNEKESVPVLLKVAKKNFRYRRYDLSRSLAIKAIRALGRISGPEADAALSELMNDPEPILADAAAEQMKRRTAV
jgi:hypothetical protein